MIDFLNLNPIALSVCALILGLTVGSFLNVVIYRLPLMLERDWRRQCVEYLNLSEEAPSKEVFNLATPRSRCPHCGHYIRIWENIPVLSYLLLRGHCSACKAKIALRYPAVELITGVLTASVAWHFGFTWETGAALLFTWALIALSAIDFDHQLLPDGITLPFVWLGALLSVFNLFTDPKSSILGAIVGYLSLWSVYQAFKWVTGKEGMGYGDFKLLALLGAWLGWQYLPVIILLSSLVGATVGISLILFARRNRKIPIPFGPYLAAAGWITLIWGEQLTQAYFNFTGMQ